MQYWTVRPTTRATPADPTGGNEPATAELQLLRTPDDFATIESFIPPRPRSRLRELVGRVRRLGSSVSAPAAHDTLTYIERGESSALPAAPDVPVMTRQLLLLLIQRSLLPHSVMRNVGEVQRYSGYRFHSSFNKASVTGFVSSLSACAKEIMELRETDSAICPDSRDTRWKWKICVTKNGASQDHGPKEHTLSCVAKPFTRERFDELRIEAVHAPDEERVTALLEG